MPKPPIYVTLTQEEHDRLQEDLSFYKERYAGAEEDVGSLLEKLTKARQALSDEIDLSNSLYAQRNALEAKLQAARLHTLELEHALNIAMATVNYLWEHYDN